ncbi:hypothetical protein HYX03_04315 [Candidatus Woesearchaeota archaeon]|nr:hypothetical protein [Candidatus Woesearchaeota archaeon]
MPKIKLIQSVLERHFTVKHKGKFYYACYLNSDKPVLGLINRDTWEVYDEEGEELNIYIFKDIPKKELRQITKNGKLYSNLISFCIRHFDDYEPKIDR